MSFLDPDDRERMAARAAEEKERAAQRDRAAEKVAAEEIEAKTAAILNGADLQVTTHVRVLGADVYISGRFSGGQWRWTAHGPGEPHAVAFAEIPAGDRALIVAAIERILSALGKG